MGTAFIEISGNALKELNALADLGEDATEILDDIGAFLDLDVTERFRNEQAPDGSKWQQSEAARTGKGRDPEKPGLTLTNTRDLAGSVTHNAENNTLEHGMGEVAYAAIHHFGGEAGRNKSVKLPARPLIGIEASQSDAILEMVTDWLI
jgi:phage virion morphogenesis protein